eukprot:11261771-Karenia_brevis.AAC.1
MPWWIQPTVPGAVSWKTFESPHIVNDVELGCAQNYTGTHGLPDYITGLSWRPSGSCSPPWRISEIFQQSQPNARSMQLLAGARNTMPVSRKFRLGKANAYAQMALGYKRLVVPALCVRGNWRGVDGPSVQAHGTTSQSWFHHHSAIEQSSHAGITKAV